MLSSLANKFQLKIQTTLKKILNILKKVLKILKKILKIQTTLKKIQTTLKENFETIDNTKENINNIIEFGGGLMMVFDENDNVKSLLEEFLSTVWDKVNAIEESQDTFSKVPKNGIFRIFLQSLFLVCCQQHRNSSSRQLVQQLLLTHFFVSLIFEGGRGGG